MKSITRAAQFWSWFLGNEHRFRNLEVPEKDALLDEIQRALHEFSPDLWFEIVTFLENPTSW